MYVDLCIYISNTTIFGIILCPSYSKKAVLLFVQTSDYFDPPGHLDK